MELQLLLLPDLANEVDGEVSEAANITIDKLFAINIIAIRFYLSQKSSRKLFAGRNEECNSESHF